MADYPYPVYPVGTISDRPAQTSNPQRQINPNSYEDYEIVRGWETEDGKLNTSLNTKGGGYNDIYIEPDERWRLHYEAISENAGPVRFTLEIFVESGEVKVSKLDMLGAPDPNWWLGLFTRDWIRTAEFAAVFTVVVAIWFSSGDPWLVIPAALVATPVAANGLFRSLPKRSAWGWLVIVAVLLATESGFITLSSTSRESPRKDANLTRAPAERPKSLHDLYKSDFSNFMKSSTDETATVGNPDGTLAYRISFGASIYSDYAGNSKFYSFYIPKAPDNQSFNFCTHLAKQYPEIMKRLSDSVLTSVKERPSDPSISSKDLTFSGRIYLYQEDEMALRQKAELEDLFKANGASIIFRGLDYLQTRWVEDAASKKIPP
jgi:hypothetical protein